MYKAARVFFAIVFCIVIFLGMAFFLGEVAEISHPGVFYYLLMFASVSTGWDLAISFLKPYDKESDVVVKMRRRKCLILLSVLLTFVTVFVATAMISTSSAPSVGYNRTAHERRSERKELRERKKKKSSNEKLINKASLGFDPIANTYCNRERTFIVTLDAGWECLGSERGITKLEDPSGLIMEVFDASILDNVAAVGDGLPVLKSTSTFFAGKTEVSKYKEFTYNDYTRTILDQYQFTASEQEVVIRFYKGEVEEISVLTAIDRRVDAIMASLFVR